jgi:hypothetical protein
VRPSPKSSMRHKCAVERPPSRPLHSAMSTLPRGDGSPRKRDVFRSCRIQTSVMGACVGRGTQNLW